MFGGFFKKKDDKPGEKVILHVYELGEGQQPQLPFGMGLYHSGVEVWRQGITASALDLTCLQSTRLEVAQPTEPEFLQLHLNLLPDAVTRNQW